MSQRCSLRSPRFIFRSFIAVALGAALLGAPGQAHAQSNIMVIFDSSGSMREKVEGGETRMTIAKRAVAVALKDMPPEVRLGLMLYGHRRARDCKDIELVAPIASEDANTLANTITKLQPLGETPIAASLLMAARSFAPLKGQNNVIVLVTDGIEECGGDPCAAARSIKASGLDIKAHIIGFTLNAKQRAAVECVVKETGGQYFDAKNANGLRDALQSIKQIVVTAAPPPPPPPPKPPERFDLLAQKNGGEMIFASGPDWGRLNDDSLGYLYGFAVGSEGVFGFREGRAASIDAVAVFIPGSDDNHPKEIEVLAGDDGPAGNFRSLGVITIANGKMRDGWQEFKLPPTTAKFVKFKIISKHGSGSSVYLYELRAYGELAAASQPAAGPATPSAPPTRVELLAQKNGGEMIFGSGPDWGRLNDESLSYAYGFAVGAEGVFGFREGRAAAIDMVAVFIPGSDDRHPKEIEVLTGDDGPTGNFRSLGVINIANGKMRDGWQEFKLPPTNAKFLKFKILSNQGGGSSLYMYELRAYGELAAATAPPAAPPPPLSAPRTRINLLAPAQGGELLIGSGNDWKRLNDDSLSYLYGFGVGDEGVFGFRAGGAATIDTLGVYIPSNDERHPKEIEVLVGDDGPTGNFRSIGVVTIANGKMRDGWQEFKLPPTTAKFVKLKILSNHGGNGVYLYELRLMGEMK